jgi:hypothetical protein
MYKHSNRRDGRTEQKVHVMLCLWFLLYCFDIGREALVNERKYSSSCDRGAHECIKFFVTTNGKL